MLRRNLAASVENLNAADTKKRAARNSDGLSRGLYCCRALLRADMCKGVAPLPLVADCAGGTGSRTAEASRSRLLALGAARHHGLVRMGRVSQSNRHGHCKQRYSESLQHGFFLPGLCREKKPPRTLTAQFGVLPVTASLRSRNEGNKPNPGLGGAH